MMYQQLKSQNIYEKNDFSDVLRSEKFIPLITSLRKAILIDLIHHSW